MYHAFMDNFRGFQDTIVPICPATFCVGENSTGKSSFLTLLYLFSQPSFWLNPSFAFTEISELGGFKDIVSAASDNSDYFTIGLLETPSAPIEDRKSKERFAFSIITFGNKEGVPRVTRFVTYSNGLLCKLILRGQTWYLKDVPSHSTFQDESSFFYYFREVLYEDRRDSRGFTRLQKDLSSEMTLFFHTLMKSQKGAGKEKEIVLRQNDISPVGIWPMIWLAPIRTKPKRIYEGFKTNFTPEGAHTPHIIRKALKTKKKWREFADLLQAYGESSGLFEGVMAHSFGKDPAAPFEVQIQLKEQRLNIGNVGYGVSQILPVIVELLTRPNGFWFAIQQPEVHLHPKAQAALGEIIHFLVQENMYNLIIETHSDYLIDRFRLQMMRSEGSRGAQILFFERNNGFNSVTPLRIDSKGRYPIEQPDEFRGFFIHEEMQLLEI